MTKVEGVTPSVNDRMGAVKATVLAEDGYLLRVCAHGQRHPVGHLHERIETIDPGKVAGRHEEMLREGYHRRGVACDGCCGEWRR